ncbi:MAG: aminotransferase class IV [Luteibaculum sp.]
MDKPLEQYLVYNGNYLPAANGIIKADNRAFLYGDGVFETFRVVNKQLWDLDSHFKRLYHGLKLLGIEKSVYFSEERIRQHIVQLLDKNQIYADARVRLSVFRNPGGYYTPKDNQLGYLLTVSNISGEGFELNHQGLAVDAFLDYKKQLNPLAKVKLINSQLYVLAGLEAQRKNLDECLILNEKGNIIESTSSNVFVVCGDVIYTPALSEGCVVGTMRTVVINLAIDLGYKIFECALTHQRLMSADEILLTNAVQGIRWVNRYKSKRYFHKIADQLLLGLNHHVYEKISSAKDPQES